MRPIPVLVAVLVLLSAACAPRGPSSSGTSAADLSAQAGRTLVAAMEAEPKSLAARFIAEVARTLHLRRILNADLVVRRLV